MEYVAIKSSNILSIGYDPDLRVMGVQFRDGSEYHYQDVDFSVYRYVIKAPSPGGSFAAVVKNNFLCQRIR